MGGGLGDEVAFRATIRTQIEGSDGRRRRGGVQEIGLLPDCSVVTCPVDHLHPQLTTGTAQQRLAGQTPVGTADGRLSPGAAIVQRNQNRLSVRQAGRERPADRLGGGLGDEVAFRAAARTHAHPADGRRWGGEIEPVRWICDDVEAGNRRRIAGHILDAETQRDSERDLVNGDSAAVDGSHCVGQHQVVAALAPNSALVRAAKLDHRLIVTCR